MRVLLTGAKGQVGRDLVEILGGRPGIELDARDRAALDITDANALAAAFESAPPDVVVNAAAYTAVDKAESDPRGAHAANARGPELLAAQARRHGALLVHYSTDYVFDGNKSEPYAEDDAANPVNEYGRSKLAGELAVRAGGSDHVILRSSWVYSSHSPCFLTTMLRLFREREELRVVDDQFGAPTWSRRIAISTAAVIDAWAGDVAWSRSGVYHLCPTGRTTWYGFARAIHGLVGARGDVKTRRIEPIPASQYRTPARRPANSSMRTDKIVAAFGMPLVEWDVDLSSCLAKAGNDGAGAS